MVILNIICQYFIKFLVTGLFFYRLVSYYRPFLSKTLSVNFGIYYPKVDE